MSSRLVSGCCFDYHRQIEICAGASNRTRFGVSFLYFVFVSPPADSISTFKVMADAAGPAVDESDAAAAGAAAAPVAEAPPQGRGSDFRSVKAESARKEIKELFALFDTQDNGTVDALYVMRSVMMFFLPPTLTGC
jgi:hypothetical protein